MTETDHTRRELLAGAGAIAGAGVVGQATAVAGTVGQRPSAYPRSPAAALAALRQGNRRYRRGKLKLRDYSPVGEDRASSQKPFAAIIT